MVALLVFAGKKLLPQGKVKITINDEKDLEVDPGGALLITLSNEGIYLPSACGGGGTCAMCKCQVLDGGGSILPTEVGYFTRKEQLNHWRLACQVKVREDLKIHVEPEVFGVKNGNVKWFPIIMLLHLLKNLWLNCPKARILISNREDIYRLMFPPN